MGWLGAWKRPWDACGWENILAFRFHLPSKEPFWPRATAPSRGSEGHEERPLQYMKWNLAQEMEFSPGYKWQVSSSRNQHYSPNSTVNIDITKEKHQGRPGGQRGVKGPNR